MPRWVPAVRISSTSRVGDGRPQLVGHQVEGQRAHVVGLGVRGEPAVGVEVLGLPGGADVLGQLGVAGGVLVAAEHAGDPGHQPRRCARSRRWRRRPCRRRRRPGSRRGPRPARATRPSGSRCPTGTARAARGSGGAPPGPGAAARGPSARPGPASATIVGHSSSRTCGVAVRAVQLPRHDDRGVAPAGRAVEEGDRALPALAAGGGADVRDGAVGPLVGGDVAQPLRRRSRRRRRGTRRSARTAASRRSSRPRSRCGQSVGMSQALSRRLQTAASCKPVEPLVAAGEPAGAPHVGVHDDAADVVRRQVAGVALDADVLEAVRGAPRLEDVAGHAGGDAPRRPGRPAAAAGRNGTAGRRCSVVTSPSASEPLAVRERDASCRPGRGWSAGSSR